VIMMPLFHYLPHAILSAIVIHAVARMMRVAELKRFYRFHPSEFGLALVALLRVITVGILPGLGIAVVLSLVRFIWGASHLSLSRLGPVPGKEHSYQVIGDASAWGAIPGLAILRLDPQLANADDTELESDDHDDEPADRRREQSPKPAQKRGQTESSGAPDVDFGNHPRPSSRCVLIARARMR
jgi:MFS superfamily sulfate permease-like transporter